MAEKSRQEQLMDQEFRRHDPELRAAVEKQLEHMAIAHEAAEALLKKALEILLGTGQASQTHAIYTRGANSVHRAHNKVSSDARFVRERPNDNYIGNLAAGEMGQTIVKQWIREGRI